MRFYPLSPPKSEEYILALICEFTSDVPDFFFFFLIEPQTSSKGYLYNSMAWKFVMGF